jgi:hypothetical protein
MFAKSVAAMESDGVEKDVRANGTREMLADLSWSGEFSFESLSGHGWIVREKKGSI